MQGILDQFMGADVGLVSQDPTLLNKLVLRTMGSFHITISLLGTIKEKHQLFINHSQTGRRVDS